MSWWEAVVLGLVQGLFEFLPVSSQGHLALAKMVFGFEGVGLAVDVVLHVATLCAVFIVFRRRLAELAWGAARRDPGAWRYLALLVLATVPAGVVGIVFEDFFASVSESPIPPELAIEFVATGFILWSTRFVGAPPSGERLTPRNAVLIGGAQALALLPAVSRSGTTVAAGMWLGVDPVRAGEFSFLLSIPAIVGAEVLELPKLAGAVQQVGLLPLALSFAVSLASGVWAIRWLVVLLSRGAFHRFAPYCWAIGAATTVWGVFGA